MPEAELIDTPNGRAVASDGWFVLNLGDAVGLRHERGGIASDLEAPDARFPDYGFNVFVLEPGRPNALYHSENVQEDFLVLAGECLAIVEDQERHLRAWDFVHCPAGTPHLFVGAGDGPCAILMVGARSPDSRAHYPVSQVAARYGGSAPHTTDTVPEAYREAGWVAQFTPEPMPWPPPMTLADANNAQESP